jgi:hypothetical protein
VLLVASPYAKRNYNGTTNTSFPGLLRTAFRLLGIPPLNLYDAVATDLAECFTSQPDMTPYNALPVDKNIFDPARVRPNRLSRGPAMDDPDEIRRQHQARRPLPQ